MSALFQALIKQPTATTFNGMPTLTTSGDFLLDLFGIIGNRGFSFEENKEKINGLFNTDKEALGRLFLWARDCRGGAGHRDPVRALILHFESKDPDFAIRLANRLPELGYYKDLIWLYEKSNSNKLKAAIIDLFIVELHSAVQEKRFSLLAKYLPRKGDLSVKFRTELELSPKSYRKLLVQLSKTVEQQMCANQWDQINFEHVPSVAMNRYRLAFARHGDYFAKYQEKVSNGDSKINSSQLFPGEIAAQAAGYCDSVQELYLTNAWNALPNFVEGNDNWLPVIDVSGSMNTHAGNTKITCINVAIGLGLYLAERNNGLFNRQFITFSESPNIIDMKNKGLTSLCDKVKFIRRSDWGYNTNIQKVFDLVLSTAKKANLTQSDMPNKLVIFSDMEMDKAGCNMNDRLFKMIQQKYQDAGYEMPQLVFWNLSSRTKNMTVNIHDNGATQVSGYTTSILKNLSNLETFSPVNVMIETLGSDRYAF